MGEIQFIHIFGDIYVWHFMSAAALPATNPQLIV